jgi:hypothetical protein
MKKIGYEAVAWIDGKDLPHLYFYTTDFELWVSQSLVSLDGTKCEFTLTGNAGQFITGG